MSESIIDISRRFFIEIVEPILAEQFPDELAAGAFGVFGHGSEALRMDDEYSSDHHWGLRIDALFPHEIYLARGAKRCATWSALVCRRRSKATRCDRRMWPASGFAPESLQRFFAAYHRHRSCARNLCRVAADPGRRHHSRHQRRGLARFDTVSFTQIRATLAGYYPEPVRLRRIAHWCRYYSGMGAYALKRAILRDNEYYANITFTRAIRLAVQLAFLLERRYFPYDKWTYARFTRAAAPGRAHAAAGR